MLSSANNVIRKGDVVLRPAGPWTHSTLAVLRYLEERGVDRVPRVVGSGQDGEGRETLSFVEGELIHPYGWGNDALVEVGCMLRRLHDCLSVFIPPRDASWKPWFLRSIGDEPRIICHCDVAPWNMLTKDKMPTGLIDWEYTGPVSPLTELARVCWLFPQLHDDIIAEKWGLPSARERATQVRLIVDAYGLSSDERHVIVDRIIEVVVHEAAAEADEMNVTFESEGPQWGLAWKIRSASWILRHRNLLEEALT